VKINLEAVPHKTALEIQTLVERELTSIVDPSVQSGLRSFLISPRQEDRDWCWHKPVRAYSVWVIAESRRYDYCIMYSDYGFGPENPWGLGFTSHKDFDADYCWFGSLEDAYRDSRLIEENNEQGVK
jgi:hypothetical protein